MSQNTQDPRRSEVEAIVKEFMNSPHMTGRQAVERILSLFQGQPAGGRPMPLKAKFTRYSRYPEYGVLEFLYDGAKASDLPGLASDIGEEIVIRINQGNQ